MKLLSHYIENQMKMYPEIVNWKNNIINNMLYYSYRDTVYNRDTYPSNLHYHDYYELVIFEEGDIKYICDSCVYYPKYGDIILIPPGKFHMSAINNETTRYKRHVFYFYPSAFDSIECRCLLSFLDMSEKGNLFSFDALEVKQKLIDLLEALKRVFENSASELEDALGLSYIIGLFYLLNQPSFQPKNESSYLPETVLLLKRYIDDNFALVSSVAQVAEHFFYSREYVSRLFKKYFDTTISDYIMKRRIAESQTLIMRGIPMIDIAYKVGFGSLSTFIRAFRAVTNMTPSEYRKLSEKQI